MGDDDIVKTGQFHIRVRKGDWEVEVSAPDKGFVLDESNRLIEEFKPSDRNFHSSHVEVIQGEVTNLLESGQTRTTKPQTLNEFYRQFKLQTHLEKILILGYWCEIRQGQSSFTSEDILERCSKLLSLSKN